MLHHFRQEVRSGHDAQTAPTAKAEANAIVEEFGFFDDWEDRYQLLIDQGRKLAPFPATFVMTRIGFVGVNQWLFRR